MEKAKERFGKLSVLLILLLIMAIGFSASKYVEFKEGSSGDMKIAKWNVVVNDISLSNTTYDGKTIKAQRIAPGTEGSFNIVINPNDTEVGIKYTVSFSRLQNKPENLYFQIKGSDIKYTDLATLGTALSGKIDASTTTATPVTKEVLWKWDYQSGSGSSEISANNAKDTADGKKASTMSFNIKVDFEQIQPA